MSIEALAKTGLRIDRQSVFEGWAMARIEQETMGGRIARLRRDKGKTQAELAQQLGVSQPVISDYKNDVIKLSGETVAQLAGLLGVSADEILGLEKSAAAKAPIKNRRLYRQLASIDKLPKRDQEALLRTIDAFLTKAS